LHAKSHLHRVRFAWHLQRWLSLNLKQVGKASWDRRVFTQSSSKKRRLPAKKCESQLIIDYRIGPKQRLLPTIDFVRSLIGIWGEGRDEGQEFLQVGLRAFLPKLATQNECCLFKSLCPSLINDHCLDFGLGIDLIGPPP